MDQNRISWDNKVEELEYLDIYTTGDLKRKAME